MNIYMGNLSYEVTEEDFKKAFEIFGEIDTVKVNKRRLHWQIKRVWICGDAR